MMHQIHTSFVRVGARMVCSFLMVLTGVLWGMSGGASAADWTPSSAELVPVEASAAPRATYALHRTGEGLNVVIEIAKGTAQEPVPEVELGVGAQRQQVEHSSKPEEVDGRLRYSFAIPAKALVDQEADWQQLRMAFTVRWGGGFNGADRRRERYLCLDHAAPHEPLPADKQQWAPMSLSEYALRVEERASRIVIPVDQPMDGKLSVVIDSADGHRIRNLVSALPVSAGRQEIVWDGLDDQRQVVPPGTYHWRAIAHPGITPVYDFSYYNHGNPPWRTSSPTSNWGADHSNPVAAATFGERVYIGAPVAESGHNIIQLDLAGNKTAHGDISAFVGRGKLLLLADADHFYALSEGVPGYEGYRSTGKDTWVCVRPTSLIRWDLEGNIVRYDGPRGEKVLTQNEIEGTGPHKAPAAGNLAGAALVGGKIYVSMAKENAIEVLDPKEGRLERKIALDQPGLIASDGKVLVVFSGRKLVRVDPNANTIEPLFEPALSAPFDPQGMAMNGQGEIFIADNGADQNIKVFSSEGKLARQIGRAGGRPIIGPWEGKTGVYRPHGIALDQKGQLWVVEQDTWPRRISVWDSQKGQLLRDFFGPGAYGAPGGSFDPADAHHWVGAATLWQIGEAKQASPLAVLYRQTKANQAIPGMVEQTFFFANEQGHRYLIGQGRGFQTIYRLDGDRRAYLCGVVGNLNAVAQSPRWTLPVVFSEVEAYREALAPYRETAGGVFKDRMVLPSPNVLRDLPSFVWVDRNEDEVMQADEIQVGAAGQILRMGYWGTGNESLSLRFIGSDNKKDRLVAFAPTGFLPKGTPVYDLASAWSGAVALRPKLNKGETIGIQDHFHRFLVNTTPMQAFDASGKELWSYPNEWSGVHGSHNAPLPERGVMQGVLAYLGAAPFDKQADVTVMNGNHGRFFVMTTDGIYLDEMFHDVRVAHTQDAYMIGGEPFGGHFGRAADGTYYLQSGHTDFRVFKLHGLDQARRLDGTIEVTAKQAIAAESRLQREVAQATAGLLRELAVTDVSADQALGNDPQAWPGDWQASWGQKPSQYPFARAKLLRQGATLHLAFDVRDPSPWVNNGKDPLMLFKTGDVVDFQFSTDPKANPRRSAAAPGDRRLLIAPFQGKAIAVLYDYRVPGFTGQPVVFASPWRKELVDRVATLASAKVTVKKSNGGYQLTAAVPLKDLGLPAAGTPAALQADVGVIYGDDSGTIDLLRWYWSNQSTGLVNDVPGETMLTPRLWGTLKFIGGGQ